MDDFEEALRNIDVFCKVLAKKTAEDEEKSDIIVEPMESLLYRKYIISEQVESSSVKHFIPLPQLEEPLIDVFEDENYVKILMQCHCKDQKVTVHTSVDGLEICKKKCHKDSNGIEVCVDECQKLNLSVERLKIEDMIMKCNNNEAFEVYIPKVNNSN
ncbi:MAG: hypothetical protein QHH17_00165 [Candidatus Bathyarchaeota archaeon]|nr:hypothetical protein [Candidatus Bathyarchaeota archaeon]